MCQPKLVKRWLKMKEASLFNVTDPGQFGSEAPPLHKQFDFDMCKQIYLPSFPHKVSSYVSAAV